METYLLGVIDDLGLGTHEEDVLRLEVCVREVVLVKNCGHGKHV